MSTKIKDYRVQFIQELTSFYDVGEAESFFYLILEEKQKLKRIDLALDLDLTFSLRAYRLKGRSNYLIMHFNQ